MKRILLTLCLAFFPILLSAQKEGARPRIGLALSGGGAKGLAHIGLLMAIDSAGINIDYVAGTSMGAVVGGLYAAGYSGKEIAMLGREVNWNRILTNKPRYDQLLLPYKDKSKQFIEVPVINKKIYFGKGVLESNELWLWLCDKFSAYNRESDFAGLPIPFRCVATRLDDGSAVVLSRGNLVKAIRASMSIPALFTPVSIDSMVLVDGGLVRNFPVSVVRDMGATLIIGSSVASHQFSINDLDNPIEILSQITFFSEKKDFRKQLKAVDILVEYPIEQYNTTSFSSAKEILQLGIERGREMIPVLKKIKDSLDQIYGYEPHREITPELEKEMKIGKIGATGLQAGEWPFYQKQMGLNDDHDYTIGQLSHSIRNAYASGNFRKITYSFGSNDTGAPDMYLDFQKDAGTHLLGGLAYNDETGLGIKLGAGMNEIFGPLSTSLVAVSIGENPQFSARNFSFLGRARRLFIETSIGGELIKLNYFNRNLATIGAFRQNHLKAEVNVEKLITGNFQLGVGSRWEYLTYHPEVQDINRPKGRANFITPHFNLKFDNQDAAYHPLRGNEISIEIGKVFNQHPKFTYREDVNSTPKLLQFEQNNFLSVKYFSAHYLSVKKSTLFAKLNAGMHFGNQLPYIYNFLAGGTNFVTNNQILFSGFRVNGISTSSAVSSQLGFRQNISSKFSASVGFNALWYDFINSNIKVPGQTGHFATGVNLTSGYESWLGPLEITLMYNSVSDRVIVAFNLGYSLNFSR